MAWATVDQLVPEGTVKNAINLDQVVRFGSKGQDGCYIHFVDGTSISVTEHINELIEILNATKG